MRLPAVAITVLAGISWYGIAWRHAHSKPAGNNGHRILYYVDPMHPVYHSDRPGTAPDCGMPLVAVYAGDPADSTASAVGAPLPGVVRVDPDTQRLVGIGIARVEKRSVLRTLHAVGRVAVEDTRIFRVNSGVDGIIRETQGDSVGAVVKKGQKLGSYYAPDFLAASSGFLAANERLPGTGNDGARTIPFPGAVSKQGTGSIQGYTDRLRNLGMSDGQIQHMAETRRLQETIDIVSPADGVVIARNISAGQHFEHSMDFYRIADLSRVWVLAEVYEPDAPHLAPGSRASVTLPGASRTFAAVVSDSLPEFESGGGSAKIRLEVENSGRQLVPEMLVDVDFQIELPATVVAPADAVVDSGVRSRVYVEAPEGVFTPREVEAGWRTSNEVEIRAGLHPGERVAAAATFLVDSESRLRAPALAAAAGPAASLTPQNAPLGTATDPSCGMPVEARAAIVAGNTLMDHGVTRYFCSVHCKDKFAARYSAPHRGGEE
jgi:YHS domain-containing protein